MKNCGHPLYLWKERKAISTYKCGWDNCHFYLSNKKKLNKAEKLLFRIKPSQFKLRYTYVECHFTQEQLIHSAPEKKETGNLFKIHHTLHTVALILTFHISLGLSARKTAFVLRNVFQVNVSYQTVLNYSEIAAYHCHKFNLVFKGPVDSLQVGDEVYSKVDGNNWFTFFFISPFHRLARKVLAFSLRIPSGLRPRGRDEGGFCAFKLMWLSKYLPFILVASSENR